MGGPGFADGVQFDEWDNFFECKFHYLGYNWSTSEQAFQALKFLDLSNPLHRDHPNFNHAMKILVTLNAQECWHLGQSAAHKTRQDWEDIKADVMFNVCPRKGATKLGNGSAFDDDHRKNSISPK